MGRFFPLAASGLLLALVVAAPALAGAPLKGVDVKLGKPPGGTPQSSRVTDAHGHFDFGVLPKGPYLLTLGFPKGHKTPAATEVAVKGPVGGDIAKTLNTGVDGASTARVATGEAIDFTSDGRHPITGTVSAAGAR